MGRAAENMRRGRMPGARRRAERGAERWSGASGGRVGVAAKRGVSSAKLLSRRKTRGRPRRGVLGSAGPGVRTRVAATATKGFRSGLRTSDA